MAERLDIKALIANNYHIMVRINKIVIQGFKSFKRKVSIPILPGYTVFTGPNGSGKSNVAESISFVLGTASRSIRARKAEELVFNGSKKKDAADYAKVSLHFDNSSKALPLPESEVIISRRLNKNGVSSYRLNGNLVNRQRIVEIFSQAMINQSGHNIIHQGDVTQIVEMMPVGRRKIIDEISGILEYEEKKQKAQKELEKVAEKLRESEIVLNERIQTLERIRRDRDAAVEHQKLQKELELVRASIIWKEYSDVDNDLSELNKGIENGEKDVGKLDKEIKDLDDKLDKEEKNLEDITSEVLKASDQIGLVKELSKIRSDVERKRDKLSSNQREIERIQDILSRMRGGHSPFIREILEFKGVDGTFESLIKIPTKYQIAISVSAGSRLHDIVVGSSNTAVSCVKHLKENRLGRARFLPMDKINAVVKTDLPKGSMGWLSDLVTYPPKYRAIVEHVLGKTACVTDVDTARDIFKTNRTRMVTLDGDLFEPSGAITGGYYKRNEGSNKYLKDIEKIEKESSDLEKDIEILEIKLEKLSQQEKVSESISSEVKKIKFDDKMKKFRERRKQCYEERLDLLQKLNELKISRAKIEAKEDNIKSQLERYKDMEKEVLGDSIPKLRIRQKDIVLKIESLGLINLKAIDEFDSLKHDFDEFKEKFDKIVTEKDTVEETIREIETRRRTVFMSTLDKISKEFKSIYKELTNGESDIKLQDQNDLESGLIISASPSGKKLLSIDSMSGGEKTLTAIAFLFAIQRHKPSPFYILDEADAALDKTNSKKITELIKKEASRAQFIVVSHNDEVIRASDHVYGVSMEDGESKIFGVKLPENN